MSLLLKKLNQASAQKAADEGAEQSAASSQQESAQPQDSGIKPPVPQTVAPSQSPSPATATPPSPAAAQPTPVTSAKPPASPASPAPITPAQPAPGSVGIKPRPVAPASSGIAKPPPGSPGSAGLRSAAPITTAAPVAKSAPGPVGIKPATTPASAPAGASAIPASAIPPKPKTPSVHLETAATAAAAATDTKGKPRAKRLSPGLRASEYFDRARGIVSAARVFGAQTNEERSQLPKILAAAAVVVVVGIGGFFAYSHFSSDIVGESVANAPTRQNTLSEQAVEVVTLPSPAIDVQAQVAALNVSLQITDDTDTDITISGEEAIADYEIVPDVQYSDEEWSLIEREEREAAEAEEQEIAIIAASEAVGVEVGREIAVQIESQRDEIDVPDDNISVRAANTAEVAKRAEIKTSEKALDRADKLSQAADFYAAGRYAQAGEVYSEVLRDTPSSLQALRGSALVAVAMRRHKLAAGFYVRILEYFPDDPLAVAGLANLGGIHPLEVERLLINLLGKTPAIDGRLYFALGNVYAASSRWRKARNAFGEALSREKNPDYAYNLAVAMEYLSEPELAAHYYRHALQMAQGSITAGFDIDKVKARIAVLDV